MVVFKEGIKPDSLENLRCFVTICPKCTTRFGYHEKDIKEGDLIKYGSQLIKHDYITIGLNKLEIINCPICGYPKVHSVNGVIKLKSNNSENPFNVSDEYYATIVKLEIMDYDHFMIEEASGEEREEILKSYKED